MHETLWFESKRRVGERLALHWWKNRLKVEVPPRGYIWIVHGAGEHGARYAELAGFLTGLGFDVLAPDLPGHGLSKAQGGATRALEIPTVCDELQDLVVFWFREGPMAKRGIARTPWYLVGHSLGGLTALAWILRGKQSPTDPEFAARAFISAPALKLRLAVPAWKSSLAEILGGVLPDIKISNGIKAEDLSYDAANVAAYRADPLVHGDATPRSYLSMVKTASDVLARPHDVEIPICLAVGCDDPIVDPIAVRGYFDSLGTHKKLLEFPVSKHEILNEVGRDRCYEALAGWFL